MSDTKRETGITQELRDAIRKYLQEHYLPEEESDERQRVGDIRKGADKQRKAGGKQKEKAGEPDIIPERIELSEGKAVLSTSSVENPESLDDVLQHVGETFQQRLLHLIAAKGMTNAEVYKRAHMDRKLFSKIRCNENYTPRKNHVIALAIALHLDLDQTADLLARAGMALSPGSKADLIVEYCVKKEIFDINTINALLDEYGQPILG